MKILDGFDWMVDLRKWKSNRLEAGYHFEIRSGIGARDRDDAAVYLSIGLGCAGHHCFFFFKARTASFSR